MKIAIFKKQYNIPLNRLNVSRQIEFGLLSTYLNLSPFDVVCDIGCGDGFWTNRFATLRNCRASGIDLNLDRLRDASKNGHEKILFVKGDIQTLPYRSDSFDKIVSICVLEHVENDVMALKEMRRVLKKDGILAITVDSFSYPGMSRALRETHRAKYHVVNYYSYDSLKEKLLGSGFETCEHRFIISSPLSRYFYELYIRQRKLSYFLFPLAYPLSVFSDRCFGRKDYGFKLGMKARAI